MNEQRNNGRGIFYGVIGIATLVVAIVGATFAYFTATAANNVITGNMATVKLSLNVLKKTTAEDTVGLIPMSNGMVEAAVSNTNICVDDNGNPVCQIYKIELENESSAGQFVDGYVALKGGSGEPFDYANDNYNSRYPIDGYLNGTRTDKLVGTTMRWAQVFCTEGGDGKLASCSTGGAQYLGVNADEDGDEQDVEITLSHIGNPIDGVNERNIRTVYGDGKFLVGDADGDGTCDEDGDDDLTSEEEDDYTEEGCKNVGTGSEDAVLTETTILGNNYDVIGANYIRVSDHTWNADNTKPESYKRQDDVTSALVFNHNIAAAGAANDKNKGIYYIVVWLTENGKNQTAGQTETTGAETKPLNPAAGSFFMGNVTFISAQGSEVSATFTDYTRVQSNNVTAQ